MCSCRPGHAPPWWSQAARPAGPLCATLAQRRHRPAGRPEPEHPDRHLHRRGQAGRWRRRPSWHGCARGRPTPPRSSRTPTSCARPRSAAPAMSTSPRRRTAIRSSSTTRPTTRTASTRPSGSARPSAGSCATTRARCTSSTCTRPSFWSTSSRARRTRRLGLGMRDVINIPYAKNGKPGVAELIIPFTNPIMVGEFVYHCHIVGHEDAGHDGQYLGPAEEDAGRGYLGPGHPAGRPRGALTLDAGTRPARASRRCWPSSMPTSAAPNRQRPRRAVGRGVAGSARRLGPDRALRSRRLAGARPSLQLQQRSKLRLHPVWRSTQKANGKPCRSCCARANEHSSTCPPGTA